MTMYVHAWGTITTVLATQTGTGYIKLNHNAGLITEVRLSVAGASDDVDIRLGNAALTSDKIGHIYKMEEINGSKAGNDPWATFNLTNNLLYYRLKNNHATEATGNVILTIVYSTAFSLKPIGDALTVTKVT